MDKTIEAADVLLCGNIYKIYNTKYPNLIYIGSTEHSLRMRLKSHISGYKKYLQQHTQKSKVRKITSFEIFDLGLDNIKIELLEYCPNVTRNELLSKEGNFILQNKDRCVNKLVPGIEIHTTSSSVNGSKQSSCLRPKIKLENIFSDQEIKQIILTYETTNEFSHPQLSRYSKEKIIRKVKHLNTLCSLLDLPHTQAENSVITRDNILKYGEFLSSNMDEFDDLKKAFGIYPEGSMNFSNIKFVTGLINRILHEIGYTELKAGKQKRMRINGKVTTITDFDLIKQIKISNKTSAKKVEEFLEKDAKS